MGVTSRTGLFGFGQQADESTDPTKWYKHKAAAIDLAIVDDTQVFPSEIGGVPVPSGMFKAGVSAGGGATLYPRLEDTFGHLLFAAFGKVTTTLAENILETSDSNSVVNTHLFSMDYTQWSYLPWMGFRKIIDKAPGSADTDIIGEEFTDGKVLGLSFSLPNQGLITCRVDALCKEYDMVEDPEDAGGWTWENATYEDYTSVPLATFKDANASIINGTIDVGSSDFVELPIVAASFQLANAPEQDQLERIYGDPWRDEITVVARSMQVMLTVKWKNPKLYQKLITGATSGGGEWTPQPFVDSLTFDVISPKVVPGTDTGSTEQYMFRFEADKVGFAPRGGIQLAGNQSVMLQLVGTVLEDDSGYYGTIKLQNDVASYGAG